MAFAILIVMLIGFCILIIMISWSEGFLLLPLLSLPVIYFIYLIFIHSEDNMEISGSYLLVKSGKKEYRFSKSEISKVYLEKKWFMPLTSATGMWIMGKEITKHVNISWMYADERKELIDIIIKEYPTCKWDDFIILLFERMSARSVILFLLILFITCLSLGIILQ